MFCEQVFFFLSFIHPDGLLFFFHIWRFVDRYNPFPLYQCQRASGLKNINPGIYDELNIYDKRMQRISFSTVVEHMTSIQNRLYTQIGFPSMTMPSI